MHRALVLSLLLAMAVNAQTQTGLETQRSTGANRELEITLRVDPAAGTQVKVPSFTAELRNIGDQDLILNLGFMLANGRKQFPDAIVLTIFDSVGKARRFDLIGPPAIAGRVDPLIVPLPIGATFSIPVRLDRYWAAASKEFEYKFQPGAYSLQAEFTGRGISQQETNLDVKGIALMPYWAGTITSDRLQFHVNK